LLQSCNDRKSQKKEYQQVTKLTPIEYNDSIIGFQEKVIKKVLDFSQNFQMLDTTQREARLNDVIIEIDNSIGSLKNLSPFYGNTKLREAALVWMNFFRNAFDREYREIISIEKKPENEISENDNIRMNDLSKSVAEREIQIHKDFKKIQQEFYKQFDIKGRENEMNQEIEKGIQNKQK
jgi:hypothetical protein